MGISKDGRSAIASDPTGENFPWYPKPVFNLKGGPGSIQEVPTVIAYCEGASPDDCKRIEAAMTPLAAKFLADAKAADEEEPEIGFAMLSEAGGIGPQLRQLMEMGDPSGEPRLMILDIPDQGGSMQVQSGRSRRKWWASWWRITNPNLWKGSSLSVADSRL